ncbi:hypothetical protein BSn5_04005 [Bacillus subtilis BSn5]|nr:hypothetical protein BSn5_04005 [Bacillus subtilis BSn5]
MTVSYLLFQNEGTAFWPLSSMDHFTNRPDFIFKDYHNLSKMEVE